MRASGLPLLPLLLLIIALLPRGLYLREDFHTWWDKNDPPAYNDPVFIDRMLNEHNRLRAMVEPPASDMLYLTWDVKLSEIAKTYIEKCIFTHNPDLDNPHVLHPVFRVVGENLWLGNPGATIVATESWYNETKFYTYSTQACTNECGHYKQVVWGNTYKLGCAAHVCDSVKGFDAEIIHTSPIRLAHRALHVPLGISVRTNCAEILHVIQWTGCRSHLQIKKLKEVQEAHLEVHLAATLAQKPVATLLKEQMSARQAFLWITWCCTCFYSIAVILSFIWFTSNFFTFSVEFSGILVSIDKLLF
ncbi:GLIPR1-like protein 2 isoform X3 [Ambystoma mexicanum]|uniref:GLIPR1-like protein 2 isoform X3 n=1 Tax=Ambystoma mexicanum TaxID=8296 RepID=UPI0037E97CE7